MGSVSSPAFQGQRSDRAIPERMDHRENVDERKGESAMLLRPSNNPKADMKQIKLRKGIYSSPLAFVCNMLLVYVLYTVCRLVFLWSNWESFATGFDKLELNQLIVGSLLFDTSAILYTNALYALLLLLPLHYKERRPWKRVAKWVFVVINGLCIAMNLADVVYFRFTGRRTTTSVFQEFSHEGNLLSIVGKEVAHHPFLLLLGIGLIALLWVLYVEPRAYRPQLRPRWKYYVVQVVAMGIFVPLCIGGMRGGFTTAVRPITLSNANQYVNQPAEAALVLNTPFSLLRTLTKKSFENPQYFTAEELDQIYSPLHTPRAGQGEMLRKNVVVLILESFGQEFVGALNKDLDGGKYKGATPFLDSLIAVSTTYEQSFANGRKSIDGMPSVLSSIPMFVEPFFLTPASLNHLSGLAGELNKESYYTAFFHGAANGSMGFQAFAKSTGFKDYFGRTEFNEDKRFRGDADFDGTWAIWDEPFLQYYATKMNEMREPFMTAVFTASSHAPFKVPEQYERQFPDEGPTVLHRCVKYSDMALRKFFAKARTMPWYKNTIFVLTADHTSLSSHPEYGTPVGTFRVPIIFFDPSGQMPAGRHEGIAKQIDIMPTILGYLRYPRPYIAFGNDLTQVAATDNYEVAYLNGVYLFVQGNEVLLFDGQKVTGLYDYKHDVMMQHNLMGKSPRQGEMERKLKAIIQSYMSRMLSDEVTIKK